MVEDSIQSLDTITCGIFQICIYDNPEVNSKCGDVTNNWVDNKLP